MSAVKQVFKIAVAGVLIVLLFIVAGVVFVNLPSTKHKASNYLSNYLKDQYGLRLESQDLDYQFERRFLKIRMKNVRIYGGKENSELFFQSKLLEAVIPYSSLRGNHFLVEKIVLN